MKQTIWLLAAALVLSQTAAGGAGKGTGVTLDGVTFAHAGHLEEATHGQQVAGLSVFGGPGRGGQEEDQGSHVLFQRRSAHC